MDLTLALKHYIHRYGKAFILFSCTTVLLTNAALAQEPDVKTKSGSNAQELAKQLSNPVASLISVPFQNNTDYGIGAYRGSKNTLNFQPVVPIKLTPNWNIIFRAILPLVTQNSITAEGVKQNGLSDATVSAFFSPAHSKVIWGAGPAFLVPTATNTYLGTEKFGLGPTGLFLLQGGGWTYGLLANQLWSVAGNADRPPVNQLFLQPFLVYNWPSGAGISAKVQSALLEAMEERQVSVGGKTYKMEPLFMVLATQNPIEQEGTYPLPEAQLDRFIMKVEVGYPGYEDEAKIVQLVREESGGAVQAPQVIPQSLVFDARKEINAVQVQPPAQKYMVDLITTTRYPEKFSKDLGRWISYGASPRGTISLDRCSRAVAWLQGRDYVTPDDIRFIVHDVLRHRIILTYEANAEGIDAAKVIDEILKVTAVT